MTIFKWIFCLLAIVVAYPCSKDGDSEPFFEELLTKKNWKLILALAYHPKPIENLMVTDAFVTMPACSKNNLIRVDSVAPRLLIKNLQSVPEMIRKL